VILRSEVDLELVFVIIFWTWSVLLLWVLRHKFVNFTSKILAEVIYWRTELSRRPRKILKFINVPSVYKLPTRTRWFHEDFTALKYFCFRAPTEGDCLSPTKWLSTLGQGEFDDLVPNLPRQLLATFCRDIAKLVNEELLNIAKANKTPIEEHQGLVASGTGDLCQGVQGSDRLHGD
jgi:hypothetical protein